MYLIDKNKRNIGNNRIYLPSGIFLMILLFVFTACAPRKTVKIALSKGKGSASYEKYAEWLKSHNPDIECIDLYFIDAGKAMEVLIECSGVVLTGGPDVEPVKYGKEGDSSRCEIDLKRDSLEFSIIKKAIELKLPVLGICRGLQILNVAYGGTLIVDIPSDFDTTVIHRMKEPDKCFHEIITGDNTFIAKITGVKKGKVNSNHHQGIEKLADIFIASSYTSDKLIESIEWKSPAGKPFLMAVQWHPERLDRENTLSKPIALAFLEKVKEFNDKLAVK